MSPVIVAFFYSLTIGINAEHEIFSTQLSAVSPHAFLHQPGIDRLDAF
jgi:hypothetical protein